MPDLFKGGFGLERETMRTDNNGKLAVTPHPFSDERFVRDFSEFQLEIITPVCDSTDQLMKTLSHLDCDAREILKKQNEHLWLYSNPPHFETEDEIIIANYTGNEKSKHDYRVYLANKYGKRIMLYSGIHLNFSFAEDTLKALHTTAESYRDFKNNLYFRLSKQVLKHSWLLVLLTAASPVYDASLKKDHTSGTRFDNIASLRNSECGYWNDFLPILDYSSLEAHIRSLNTYISNGKLFSAAELYLPVRLKPVGSNCLERLTESGVNHIELRMFDVNPLAPLGIFKEELDFAHYFLIYLMQLPDFDFTPQLQKQAIADHKAAAKYDLGSIRIGGRPALNAGLELLDKMCDYFKDCPFALKNIGLQKAKLLNDNRYCVKIYDKYYNNYNSLMN